MCNMSLFLPPYVTLHTTLLTTCMLQHNIVPAAAPLLPRLSFELLSLLDCERKWKMRVRVYGKQPSIFIDDNLRRRPRGKRTLDKMLLLLGCVRKRFCNCLLTLTFGLSGLDILTRFYHRAKVVILRRKQPQKVLPTFTSKDE